MRNAIATQSALWALAVVLFAPMAACGGSDDSQSAEAAAQAITRAKPDSGNTSCPFVTAEQLEHILQVSMQLSRTSNNIGQCVWESSDDPDGLLTVDVGDSEWWETPTGAPNYKELSGIGREAYVVPEFDGWRAGVLLEEDKIIVVQVLFSGKTEAMAVELLKTVKSNIKAN